MARTKGSKNKPKVNTVDIKKRIAVHILTENNDTVGYKEFTSSKFMIDVRQASFGEDITMEESKESANLRIPSEKYNLRSVMSYSSSFVVFVEVK